MSCGKSDPRGCFPASAALNLLMTCGGCAEEGTVETIKPLPAATFVMMSAMLTHKGSGYSASSVVGKTCRAPPRAQSKVHDCVTYHGERQRHELNLVRVKRGPLVITSMHTLLKSHWKKIVLLDQPFEPSGHPHERTCGVLNGDAGLTGHLVNDGTNVLVYSISRLDSQEIRMLYIRETVRMFLRPQRFRCWGSSAF